MKICECVLRKIMQNNIVYQLSSFPACVCCLNTSSAVDRGAIYQNFQCSAFYFFALHYYFICVLYFVLCFAVFYVSLHYVLPALQFNCAFLIFMNMYVLLVSVCKCIVYDFYVLFIYFGSKAHRELMLYCLCLADFK